VKTPKSFECIGTTIPVRKAKLPKKYGHFDSDELEIVLHNNLPTEKEAITFLHEFYHCALYIGGFDELWDNEQLVEYLAQVHYQLEKSTT